MELPLSEYTQKMTTYTYLPPSSDGMTLPSDYTGLTRNLEKKKLLSTTMELMSQLTVKNPYSQPTSDISATTTGDPHSISNPPQKHMQNLSHQNTCLYIYLPQKYHPENTVLSTLPPVLPDFIQQANNLLKQK